MMGDLDRFWQTTLFLTSWHLHFSGRRGAAGRPWACREWRVQPVQCAFIRFTERKKGRKENSTGCPICSWTWVELTMIWVFHLLAWLPSHFCQIRDSLGRICLTVENSKSKSGARADGTPCNSLHFLQVCPRRRGLRWPGRGEQLGQQIVGREGKLAVQLWYCTHSCRYFIWTDLV